MTKTDERRELNREMETRMALIEQKVDLIDVQNRKDHSEIKECIDDMNRKLDRAINEKADRKDLDGKADKDDFITLRNWVVGGIIISIFLMVLSMMARG